MIQTQVLLKKFPTILLFVLLLKSPALFSQSSELTKPSPPPLTVTKVQAKGSLIIGMDIPYGVMEFYDKQGNPTGIDVDLAHTIANKIGVVAQFEPMPFNQLFKALQSGSIDAVISAVTITSERQKTMLFSTPYLNAGMSLAIHESNQSIRSLNDLDSKTIGVLKGTVGEKMVRTSALFKKTKIKSYQINDKRINDLKIGKLDAIVVHFLIKDFGRLKLIGEPLSESYYGVVTRKNNIGLISKINSILREMKRSGELTTIRRKYLK